MKLIVIFVCLFLSSVVSAQITDLSKLPNYDCSLKKVSAIIGRRTVIVSPDKSVGLEKTANDYCATLGSNCVLKKESELTGENLSNDLFLIGVLKDFKKWASYKTPITPTEKGFVINNANFQTESDGFAFVDTNRIIVSGNSVKAVKDAQSALTGGHDIVITQNGKITFFGNRTGNHFDWFNLQNLVSTNYNQKSSDLFSGIYVSKTFNDSIDYVQLDKELNLYKKQFLSIYKINAPAKKIRWFVHSNMQEYGTMSGMFGLTCPGNNSAGFSIRSEIHTNGYNIALVKHEYSHYLFDNTIPQDNNRDFFVEGSVEYVTNLNDSSLFKKRVAIAKEHKEKINYTDLIINNKDFYGQYSDSNYSISGVFVKYIIDNFGADNFKKYCLAKNKETSTKETFGKTFQVFINEYKSWLEKQ